MVSHSTKVRVSSKVKVSVRLPGQHAYSVSSIACAYDLVDVLALSLLSSADADIGTLTSTDELIAKKTWTVNDRDK